jgi:KDO2-lipid IV(A) lauroyltransferase
MIEAIEYLLFTSLRWIAQQLPYRVVGKMGGFLGAAVFRYTNFRKKITIDNLTKALPRATPEEIHRIALGAYRNYGAAVMEMLWASDQSSEVLKQTVRVHNLEVFNSAFAQGRGVVLLSAHFGNWEFIVGPLRLHLNQPVSMIIQHQQNKRIDDYVDRARCRFGNTSIPMGPSVREVLKVLSEGRAVVMLGDQSGPRESAIIDFFGRPAATRRGPAVFCLKTGAPIVMVFLVRQSDATYVAMFETVDMSGLDCYSEDNVVELTRRHTAVLEAHIRKHPDHWLWMHKRWKHTAYFESMTPAEDVA